MQKKEVKKDWKISQNCKFSKQMNYNEKMPVLWKNLRIHCFWEKRKNNIDDYREKEKEKEGEREKRKKEREREIKHFFCIHLHFKDLGQQKVNLYGVTLFPYKWGKTWISRL